MKIFSAKQLYEADSVTVKKQHITSTELMERAGNQVFKWIQSQFEATKHTIYIFCGAGNNGGDGLVIGRYLLQHHYHVKLYKVCFRDRSSDDFSINSERLAGFDVTLSMLMPTSSFPDIAPGAVVIDAIFGIGLSRPPANWVVALIQHINRAKAYVIAIDIPSGSYMHAIPEDKTAVVHAAVTLTFQVPKLVFFLPQTGKYVGKWEVLDIGLDQEYLDKTPTEAQLLSKSTLLKWYRRRERFSHKGTYGHGLIIGGSYGKIGAVILAAKSCITSGAGLVTAYVPKCGYTILQTALPEIMVITDRETAYISAIDFDIHPKVIGIGVGLGTHDKTQHAFIAFLKQNAIPLVIDADGLNILAQHKAALEYLPVNTILTPHPKELERLIGTWKDDFDKLEKVKDFTKKYDVIVVIKGAYTIIVDKD
ncbi:MAG: NAD(P)H-hydrate dehydratase, partial [Bacteroidota bacterium]